MQKRKTNVILAGAVMAALPISAYSAVNVNYTIDPNVSNFLLTSSASPGTFVSLASVTGASYNATNNTLTIPQGYDFVFGVDGQVSGTSTAHSLPAQGISEFGIGLNNSNASIASVSTGGAGNTAGTPIGGYYSGGNPVYATIFKGDVSFGPEISATGGVATNTAIGDGSTATDIKQTNTAALTYGSSAPALMATYIEFDTTGTAGTDVISIAGVAGSTSFTYTSASATKTLTITGDGGTSNVSSGTALTVIVSPSTTGATTQNIISLTTSTPSTYGSALNGLTVNGSSAAGYAVTSETITATNKAYAPVTWNVAPTSGTEAYALKLSSSSEDTNLIADINAQSATDGGIVASAVGGIYSTPFSGYDIVITEPGSINTSALTNLGFDLSQTTDGSGITVTGVAAVPEPATAAGLVIGAAGLLLGRRKGRTA
jgi:hypothetical protein